VIGISIGVVILAGLYWFLVPGPTSPSDASNRAAVAQDNVKNTKPTRASNGETTEDEPAIRVRRTEQGVFVEKTEPLQSDPAMYREQSVFERSPDGRFGTRLGREQAAKGGAGAVGGEAAAGTRASTPDGAKVDPGKEGERKGGNQAGGWY
jgi:hypothetical protein